MMTDASTSADTTALAPLQMQRAEVNVREFQRWAGMRRLQDTDHAMHIWACPNWLTGTWTWAGPQAEPTPATR